MVNPKEGNLLNTQSANSDTIPISVKELLEAGVHFGHKKFRWNPKMKPFVFTERHEIHIIDLRKTLNELKKAYFFIKKVSRNGGSILFVCTKQQGKDIVEEEAIRCGAFYVTERWLGGLLTNFSTVKSRIEYMKDIERMKETEQTALLPKKERTQLEKKLLKLQKVFNGIRDMETSPDVLFVVDIVNEEIAVNEARKLGIPVVGIVDTNGDPTKVTYPIPGNDDAIRSIRLMTKIIADAVIEGREGEGGTMEKREEEIAEDKS